MKNLLLILSLIMSSVVWANPAPGSSAKEYSSLPGVPDGEYLVIQFQTDFQNKKTSTEILTLSKNSGKWLTVGYFIQ